MIKRGLADVIFAGGVEGLVQECLIAGLEAMGVMATGYADNPTEASRPFDAERRGLVFSEGVAIMVLESLAHAPYPMWSPDSCPLCLAGEPVLTVS